MQAANVPLHGDIRSETMSETRHHGGETADMRDSINNQIQAWASRAKWVDPEKADRLFDAIERRPEDWISPDPETCGSYREEASRIYDKIKREHGLLTVNEARKETDSSYDDQRKRAAAQKLRDEFETIESGDRDELVEDITAVYGDDFVREVLADERIERRLADYDVGELADSDDSVSSSDESDDNAAKTEEKSGSGETEAESDSETMSTRKHTPLSRNESRIGNALIAAGEWMNNRDTSVRSLWGTTKQVAHGIWTMPLYLLVAWVIGLTLYVPLKATGVTIRLVAWVVRGLCSLLAAIPRAARFLTMNLEAWLSNTVLEK